MKTGSYTGDGATSLAVTGVGFKPKYVRIWPRTTADNTSLTIYETTDVIIDDNASGMAIRVTAIIGSNVASYTEIDAVISLDSDGFTVDDQGTDSHPNTSGTVYNYLVLG